MYGGGFGGGYYQGKMGDDGRAGWGSVGVVQERGRGSSLLDLVAPTPSVQPTIPVFSLVGGGPANSAP